MYLAHLRVLQGIEVIEAHDAVLVIACGGRIGYPEALGHRNKEAGAAMTLDSIFRIASMTKPVVSVAAMALAEEGWLDAGRRPHPSLLRPASGVLQRMKAVPRGS
jgi:hypothetical protein